MTTTRTTTRLSVPRAPTTMRRAIQRVSGKVWNIRATKIVRGAAPPLHASVKPLAEGSQYSQGTRANVYPVTTCSRCVHDGSSRYRRRWLFGVPVYRSADAGGEIGTGSGDQGGAGQCQGGYGESIGSLSRADVRCQTQVNGAEGRHTDGPADLQRGGADAADVRRIAGRHGARKMGNQRVESGTQPEPADPE